VTRFPTACRQPARRAGTGTVEGLDPQKRTQISRMVPCASSRQIPGLLRQFAVTSPRWVDRFRLSRDIASLFALTAPIAHLYGSMKQHAICPFRLPPSASLFFLRAAIAGFSLFHGSPARPQKRARSRLAVHASSGCDGCLSCPVARRAGKDPPRPWRSTGPSDWVGSAKAAP